LQTGNRKADRSERSEDDGTAAVHPQRRAWTAKELNKLKELAAENLPPALIGMHLGRLEPAILRKALQAGITLMPLNRPPYGG
jgi:hypothetical protein